ncbi:hypothetical protein C8R46DRAFT_1092081, partial [Mycena filopes]
MQAGLDLIAPPRPPSAFHSASHLSASRHPSPSIPPLVNTTQSTYHHSVTVDFPPFRLSSLITRPSSRSRHHHPPFLLSSSPSLSYSRPPARPLSSCRVALLSSYSSCLVTSSLHSVPSCVLSPLCFCISSFPSLAILDIPDLPYLFFPSYIYTIPRRFQFLSLIYSVLSASSFAVWNRFPFFFLFLPLETTCLSSLFCGYTAYVHTYTILTRSFIALTIDDQPHSLLFFHSRLLYPREEDRRKKERRKKEERVHFVLTASMYTAFL